MPRTGGTSVANLLFADMCEPLAEKITVLRWDSACGNANYKESCKGGGRTDNEFFCHPGVSTPRRAILHAPFVLHQKRGEDIKKQSGASEVVYVTTLRTGADRLLSHWKKELLHGSWIPPSGVPKNGNESLQLYIKDNAGKHWFESPSASYRNNMQVAFLASTSRSAPTLQDLEVAKQVLMTGPWLIGFTGCMHKLHEKMESIASKVNSQFRPKPMFGDHIGAEEKIKSKEGLDIFDLSTFSQETLDLLAAETALDNELYKWAWNQAAQTDDPRWAGTC